MGEYLDMVRRDRANRKDLIGVMLRALPPFSVVLTGADAGVICPFHSFDVPSWTVRVSGKSQLWECDSCGAGGDTFDFVQSYFGFTFQEAMEWLNGA